VILKNISEAKAELSALIDAVSKGEEVLIGKAGVPVAKLVRYTGVSTRRVPGALKGRIVIHDDFDELPPDIAAAFGIDQPRARRTLCTLPAACTISPGRTRSPSSEH
jgi:antitoxin (DNA-binding transcriptional repressor) of toxin-antitoxin stability system